MYTFTISTDYLRAALLHAGKKDIRAYLNGVYLDGSRGTIVSTDGQRMFVCRADIPAGVRVIIGRAHLEKALKLARRAELIDVTVEPVEPGPTGATVPATVTLTVAGASMTEPELDGTYPDYARVIPTAVSGEPAVYNPQYLVDGVEALRLATGLKKLYSARMAYNGTGAGVMHLNGDAIVVVMPVRDFVDNVFPDVLNRTAADATADASAA